MYMVELGLEQVSSVGTAKIHVTLCGYAVDVRLYRCLLIKLISHAKCSKYIYSIPVISMK